MSPMIRLIGMNPGAARTARSLGRHTMEVCDMNEDSLDHAATANPTRIEEGQ